MAGSVMGKYFNSFEHCNSHVKFRAKLNSNLNKVKLSVALGNQKPKSNGSRRLQSRELQQPRVEN